MQYRSCLCCACGIGQLPPLCPPSLKLCLALVQLHSSELVCLKGAKRLLARCLCALLLCDGLSPSSQRSPQSLRNNSLAHCLVKIWCMYGTMWGTPLHLEEMQSDWDELQTYTPYFIVWGQGLKGDKPHDDCSHAEACAAFSTASASLLWLTLTTKLGVSRDLFDSLHFLRLLKSS